MLTQINIYPASVSPRCYCASSDQETKKGQTKKRRKSGKQAQTGEGKSQRKDVTAGLFQQNPSYNGQLNALAKSPLYQVQSYAII